MKNKRNIAFFALCFVFALLAAPVFSQTAEEMENLLASDAITYEQAAWFVLRAAEILDSGTPADAFRHAQEQKWLPKNTVSNGRASLEGVSLLLMESFKIKGGLFYSFARSPHYAYREMVYLNIIQGRADPDMTVSGDFLLFMLGRVLSQVEDDPWYKI